MMDGLTKKALRTGVSALLAAAALPLGTAPANATAPEQIAQSERSFDFQIAAKPLLAALTDFTATTGIQVIQPSDQSLSGTAPAVTGVFSASAALTRLLEPSGWRFRFTDPRTAVLEKVADGGAMTLGPVMVQGTGAATAETAWGPVQGYVATRSATATKTDTPILETPHSISVVTAEQIADRKATTVEDAVAYTAGVRIGGSGMDMRFDQMSIRGFSATSSSDYLDGLRQTNTGWLSYYGTEPYALERVEILKGPASVLYGQINPGGLINRVSKRPMDTPWHELEIQAGNNDHYQGQFDIGGRATEDGKLLYRLVGVARDAKTDIEWVDNDTKFLAPSVTWRPDSDTRITLLTQYQFKRTGGSQRPFQIGSDLTHFWAGDEKFDRLEQTQYTAGYDAEHAVNDALTLRQNFRFGAVDTVNQYTSGTLSGDGHTINRTAYGVYEDMKTVAVDNQAVLKFATGPVNHTLLGGMDYTWLSSDVLYTRGAAPTIDMWNPDHHQDIDRPGIPVSDQDNMANMMGIYLQEQMAVDGWRLSGGLRRDIARTNLENHLTGVRTKTDANATSGNIGALYLFESGFAPYVSYATSFMPETGTDADGNPYKPTRGKQYEAGVKFQPPGRNSMITASLYQLTQTNVRTTDPDNVLFSVQTGERRSRGLELEGVAELDEGLRLLGSLTLSNVEVTKSNSGNEGLKPVNTPEKLASLWMDYTAPSGMLAGLGGGAGFRWIGSSYDDAANTRKNEDYSVADAAIHYDLGGSLNGARLALNINNVFDKDYIICENGLCYRGQGRSVIGSIRYRW